MRVEGLLCQFPVLYLLLHSQLPRQDADVLDSFCAINLFDLLLLAGAGVTMYVTR
jgi:hypothetical protein